MSAWPASMLEFTPLFCEFVGKLTVLLNVHGPYGTVGSICCHAALNSVEIREFFDERTNRFNIKQDEEFDIQENRENLEEASLMVNKLFECVKGMVQDNWSMQREEEDRAKQVGLNRPTEDRAKQVGLNRPTPARKLKQRKLRRDGQLYSLLYELGVAVRINFNARLNEDLRWMWDKLRGKQSAGQRILDSIRGQCRIVSSLDLEHEISSLDLEHETGMNLEKECRESRDKIETIIRELLKEKAMKEQLTDTARQKRE